MEPDRQQRADVLEAGCVHRIRQRLPGALHVPHRLDPVIVAVAEFVQQRAPGRARAEQVVEGGA